MKTALVTGASGGIGKAICRALEADGIKVVKTSTSIEDGILADLRYDVMHMCHAVLREVGVPDIIIHSAGILPDKLIADTAFEDIKDAFQVNLFAPIMITAFFASEMMKRKSGELIYIGSSSCYEASARRSIYAATKHGLLGFVRAMDDELRPYNIRVHIISPQSVETSMHKDTPIFNRDTLILPKDLAEAVMYVLKSDGPGIIKELRISRYNC